GQFVTLRVSAVDAVTTANGTAVPATISGPEARAYIQTLPSAKTIDGVFNEWTNTTPDPIDPIPDHLDIVASAMSVPGNAYFYLALGDLERRSRLGTSERCLRRNANRGLRVRRVPRSGLQPAHGLRDVGLVPRLGHHRRADPKQRAVSDGLRGPAPRQPSGSDQRHAPSEHARDRWQLRVFRLRIQRRLDVVQRGPPILRRPQG